MEAGLLRMRASLEGRGRAHLAGGGGLALARIGIGGEDRARLQAHLDAVRELEQRIDVVIDCEVPPMPTDVPTEIWQSGYYRRADMQLDLLAMALQCGLTNYASFMLADGARWFRSTAYGDEKDRVVERENGQRTYFASDIAYHAEKFQRGYARVIDICDGAWGVRCSQSLQGVEPLSPQGTAEGVPVTGSLTPRLEWQPSTRPGVTYDVVVYESLWITLAGLRSARIPGPRVAYAQGLREPGFAPAAELARGRIYAWSVRLRDGDTVSSWSSTSYSDFAGTSRGWGQSFHFATPSTR